MPAHGTTSNRSRSTEEARVTDSAANIKLAESPPEKLLTYAAAAEALVLIVGKPMADDASIQKIDWAGVARQFLFIRSEIQKSLYPSEAEIARYKASLAAPSHIRSPLAEQFDAKQRHAIKDADRLEMLKYSWQILGNGDPDPELPEFMRASLTNHMDVVEKCIDQRSLTLEFLHSWGEVKFAFGILSAVLINDETAREIFFNRMARGVRGGDATIQKHWYALWLQKGGLFDDPPYESRNSLNDEMAELCFDVYKGRRMSIDYPVSWFRSLIYVPEEDGKSSIEPDKRNQEPRLSRLYLDLSIDEIKEIIEHPVIELAELPPLSPDSYPEIPQS